VYRWRIQPDHAHRIRTSAEGEGIAAGAWADLARRGRHRLKPRGVHQSGPLCRQFGIARRRRAVRLRPGGGDRPRAERRLSPPRSCIVSGCWAAASTASSPTTSSRPQARSCWTPCYRMRTRGRDSFCGRTVQPSRSRGLRGDYRSHRGRTVSNPRWVGRSRQGPGCGLVSAGLRLYCGWVRCV